ncbi:MAG: SDR family oxidoreductase [Planctomycetota bacterium JB042]
MDGKTCVVTGANAGIGKATATGLAKRGARVIMVCRDRGRGEAARAEVARESGSDRVELRLGDLSSLADVRRLASELAGEERIDVLLNNAAIMPRGRETSADGHELQFAVNHLAPFLLTTSLLDRLKASAPARVVTVASNAHRKGVIDFDDLDAERGYDSRLVYCTTKLMNVLFTRELARRLDGTGVTANCLHPGVISTTLLRQYFPPLGPFAFLTNLFFKSPEDGAKTSIWAATAPELDGVSGRYLSDEAIAEAEPRGRDDAVAKRLWDVSEELCGRVG